MKRVIVVGAGPAGLMAAEQLADAGFHVDVFEQMPTAGRKLLRAGIGGLNITHSEPKAAFVARYSRGQAWLAPQLDVFDAASVVDFLRDLGVETFVGSSGRVFPVEKKAAPFLRRWLARLREKGMVFHYRHRLIGLSADSARFEQVGLGANSAQQLDVAFDACVLALGGGSWAELGSDGCWLPMLATLGVKTRALLPSNMGFTCASVRGPWSAKLQQQAGQPLKHIRFHWQGQSSAIGECVITEQGLEGGLVYACASAWRELMLANNDDATPKPLAAYLDLLPHIELDALEAKLATGRGKQSLSQFLRKQCHLDPAKLALVYECLPQATSLKPAQLAAQLKALPLSMVGFAKPERAISTAGGVDLSAVEGAGKLQALPKVYCVGEMLDWDAPTGGYLLTACFANGVAVARSVQQALLTH